MSWHGERNSRICVDWLCDCFWLRLAGVQLKHFEFSLFLFRRANVERKRRRCAQLDEECFRTERDVGRRRAGDGRDGRRHHRNQMQFDFLFENIFQSENLFQTDSLTCWLLIFFVVVVQWITGQCRCGRRLDDRTGQVFTVVHQFDGFFSRFGFQWRRGCRFDSAAFNQSSVAANE